MKVHGERRDKHPKLFEKLQVIYEVTGKGVQLQAVQQAVHLSEAKYCSVTAMIRASVPITSEVLIHEATQ